jgi:hypothetical protein
MTPAELIAFADRILALPESADLIPLLADYAEEFGVWFNENGDKIRSLESLSKDDELFELQRKHTAVLNLAQALKGEVSNDLRALKKKGKGILAYTDVFPSGRANRSRKKI